MSAIEDAVALIRDSSLIAIATHVSPDPDAIGSMLGCGIGLRLLGKQVLMLSTDPVPMQLEFLPELDTIVSSPPPEITPDLLIALDASDQQRLGDAPQPWFNMEIPCINIDHHTTNLHYGTVNLVIPEASATAEVLVPLLRALEVVIRPNVAMCLLAGLIGDTRGFSTSNVTANTLRIAADLVETGVDMSYVTEQLLGRRSLDVLRLWGIALSDIRFEGGVIWAHISKDERMKKGVHDTTETGLSSLLLSVVNAKVSAVFMEIEHDQVEISMRARPGLDISQVALSLGGGGHAAAAGCTVKGPLDTASSKVIALLKKVAKET